MVKQAYSAWVLGHFDTKPRKWHLTAYFTYSDLPRLPTIDQDPILRGVTVPAGMYRSGKARSRNSDATGTHTPVPPSSSPSPFAHGHSTSSASGSGGQALPSLHVAIASAQQDGHLSRRVQDGRPVEDQRMIQMLNSRHII